MLNRLKRAGQPIWQSLGMTLGWRHFHLGNDQLAGCDKRMVGALLSGGLGVGPVRVVEPFGNRIELMKSAPGSPG